MIRFTSFQLKAMIVIGLTLMQASAAAQIHRSSSGMGDALIVPYWTASGGNDTLISLRNDSDRASVAKLNWISDQGEVVRSFNVYLDARSIWADAVTLDPAGESAIRFPNDPGVRQRCVLYYDSAENAGEFNYFDDDPNSIGFLTLPLISRYGSVEIIEMASVDPSSDLAPDGRWIDCGSIYDRFAAQGSWATDLNADLEPPARRLSASASIINVADGVFNTIPATALHGFSDVPQHNAPQLNIPDLRNGVDGSLSGGGLSSMVCTEDGCRTDVWSQSLEAIAAALTATTMTVDYNVDFQLAAEFEWMVHRPLKRYEILEPDFATDSEPLLIMYSRSGSMLIDVRCGAIISPPLPWPFVSCDLPQIPVPGGDIHQSMPFNQTISYPPGDGVFGDIVESDLLGHPAIVSFYNPRNRYNPNPEGSDFSELTGSAELQLGSQPQPLTAADGTVFLGEPVISFAVQQFTNGFLADGVLANYRGTELPRKTLELIDGP